MKKCMLLIATLMMLLSSCAGIDSQALKACGECASYGNALLNQQSEEKQVDEMFRNMGIVPPVKE